MATVQLAFDVRDREINLVTLDDGDQLFLKLTREVRTEGCTLRPAGLEDLFLKLTGRELRE